MNSIRNSRTIFWAMAAACAAVLALVCVAFASPAHADEDNVQLDAPTTVSDDVTRLNVNKLDADTHGYVSGATMAIINAETGEVVDSWVTGTSTHVNEKTLDVGVTYILRELSAPSGYDKVADVRFVVNETEGSGISIVSENGDEVELTESYVVSLYDKPQSTTNETTVTKTTSSSTTSSTSSSTVVSTSSSVSTSASTTSTTTSTSKTVAPKTGDETPLSTVAALAFAGVAIILLIQLVKRRLRRNE